MPLNSTGLAAAAAAVQAELLYAQLHTAAAGVAYDENLSSVGRQPASWGVPVAGAFGLASQISFSGGVANEVVYSVTLWDAESDGTCLGEFVITGDGVFSADGSFAITAMDFTVTATDS